MLFYGHLQILPGGGRLDDWLDPPTHVTGFYLLDALLEGNGEVFFNALIPSITVLGLALGDLLYGAVLTETVFAWPGMGAWVVTSIQALDFPAVMGFAVVVSFAYVLVNLVVDLLYLWIDPRIGRGGGE